MERLWLVAERLHSPFVISYVLEVDGEIDTEELTEACRTAAATAPALSARLAGRWAGTRWEPGGPICRVRSAEAASWDGNRSEGAAFMDVPFDLRAGPTSELVVVRGRPTRLLFRISHALVDGLGALYLFQTIVATLRGEAPPSLSLTPRDVDLAREFGVPAEKIPRPDSAAPFDAADEGPLAVRWAVRRVEGNPGKLLPRLVLTLARRRPIPAPRTFRVMVPVDLRQYRPDIQSSANLTGMLRIDVRPLLDSPDPITALSEVIVRGRREKQAAQVILASEFGRWLPVGFMGWMARRDARRALREARYGSAAVVSNLGRVDLATLSAPGFAARRLYVVPPGNPGLPLFLTILGHGDSIELCAAVSAPLASGEQLTQLLDDLEASLVR